jgi:uncharacterized membrane protein
MLFSFRTYFHGRMRLLIAMLAGVICFLALPPELGDLQRLLIGWNVLAWLYLFFMWFRMLRTDVQDIPHIARMQDERGAGAGHGDSRLPGQYPGDPD